MGVGWGIALAGLIAVFIWRLFRGKRAARQAAVVAMRHRFNGEDSEFYAVEARLAARAGARAAHESLAAWLARIEPAIDRPLREALARAKALHERYRFDPRGIGAGERRALRSECLALSARFAERTQSFDWTRLADAIGLVTLGGWPKPTMPEMKAWGPRVARYSF